MWSFKKYNQHWWTLLNDIIQFKWNYVLAWFVLRGHNFWRKVYLSGRCRGCNISEKVHTMSRDASDYWVARSLTAVALTMKGTPVFGSQDVCIHWKIIFLNRVTTNRSVNSLGQSDVIWRHWSESILAQVMACCLTAPIHSLDHCWLIINKIMV